MHSKHRAFARTVAGSGDVLRTSDQEAETRQRKIAKKYTNTGSDLPERAEDGFAYSEPHSFPHDLPSASSASDKYLVQERQSALLSSIA